MQLKTTTRSRPLGWYVIAAMVHSAFWQAVFGFLLWQAILHHDLMLVDLLLPPCNSILLPGLLLPRPRALEP